MLSDRWRCLRPDAYGCGSSPPSPPGIDLDGVAEAVLAALDDRGVGEVAVVGLSMGGYLAMALLRRAPDRVRALVLAATRATPDTDAARAERHEMARRVRTEGVDWLVETMVQRLLSPRGREEAHVADPVRARIRRCTPDGIAACLEALAARPDSTSLLARTTVPTLVLGGAEDAVTPPAVLAELAATVPGARCEILDGAGHLSNLEQPARFGELLGGFLEEAYPVS